MADVASVVMHVTQATQSVWPACLAIGTCRGCNAEDAANVEHLGNGDVGDAWDAGALAASFGQTDMWPRVWVAPC